MKVKLVVCLVWGLMSCSPPVTFDQPMPPDVKNLDEIPERLRGLYQGVADPVILEISAKSILKIYHYEYPYVGEKIDSMDYFRGDTLIRQLGYGVEQRYLTINRKDTLWVQVQDTGVVFRLDEQNVLRKYQGYYVLNCLYGEAHWEVKLLNLIRGRLKISSISRYEDLQLLQAITETIADTVPVRHFSVDRRQWSEFIEQDGFSDSELYIRVKRKG